MRKWVLAALAAAPIAAAPLLAGWAYAPGERASTGSGQTVAPTAPAPEGPSAGSYATIGPLKMYYAIHGQAAPGTVPLVLLHGAFGTIEGWGPLLASLSQGRQVIALEAQAHGHTADVDRPLSVEQMADDTAALLRQLNITRADAMGYSMGGQTAVTLAARHPDLVRKLVVVSAPFDPPGWKPGVHEGVQGIKPEDLMATPLYDLYKRVAPDPNGFAQLVARVQQAGRSWKGLTAEEVRAIKAPTLIATGDADGLDLKYAADFFGLRGGGAVGDLAGLPSSQLAVLPGTTHVGIVTDHADWLVAMVSAFLNAPVPAGG